MSERVIQPAPVRKSIVVKAAPARAFDVFVNRISHWWPADKSISRSPQVDVVLEPRVGGRWFERGADGSTCEWGKVLAFEPPRRLLLAWQIGGEWRYDASFVTEVEIIFTPLDGGETRIDLEHRNLERYGDRAEALRAGFDSEMGWTSILDRFAEAAA